MIIAQVSDIHAAENNDNLSRFEHALAWIDLITPDALVLSGDLIDDNWCDGYAAIAAQLNKRSYPSFILPGNSDDRTSMKSILKCPYWNNTCEDGALHFVLEKTQRGDMDLTHWLSWFLQMLESTVDTAIQRIDQTLDKSRFWQIYHASNLSAEQIKVLNRLLDGGEKGFAEGINASQYQKVAKVSKATATRHLTELVSRGCLVKSASGGRSTRYHIHRIFNSYNAGKFMKNITFYGRFEADILAGRKTITLREASDANFAAGDQVRVSRYEDDVFFCNIEIIAITPVQFADLNDQHAIQENMTLAELKQVISEIYPGLNELFMIEFRLL